MPLLLSNLVIPAKAGIPLTYSTAESCMQAALAFAGLARERRMKGGWVYIMADRYRGALYIGVTANIVARVFAHREGRGSSHCARYGLTHLVYAEQAPTIEEAIAREKAMKKWRRALKIELIEQANPNWDDFVRDDQCLASSSPRMRGSRFSVPKGSGTPACAGVTVLGHTANGSAQ